MVKRPLEEENGQNLESICRAVKRLHTSSEPLSENLCSAAQDQFAGTHPAAPQQPVSAANQPLSPGGQPPKMRVTRPSWLGADSAVQAAAQTPSRLHAARFDGAAMAAEAETGLSSNAVAAAAALDPVLQRQQQALEQQLQQQKLLHEQQYLARQQQAQLLEAQQLQDQQQQVLGVQQQQHQQRQLAAEQRAQQRFGGADFAEPSTPRQEAEEQNSAAMLAREHAAYEASNTLLKELHFERLRRLTIGDDEVDGSSGRWLRV